MDATSTPVVGLYEHVLGPRWQELAEVVRRLHTPGAVVTAKGVFRVTRGNWLARGLATLMGLPGQADASPVHLTVTPTGMTEEWRRLIGGNPFVSKQWLDADMVVEQLGLSETHIAFDVVNGELHYRTARTVLRLGFARVPLPGFLAPRVQASEKPDGDKLQIFVEVRLPMLGRLICYEGTLSSIDV